MFFWDGIGWNLDECIQRKSTWVTVISDDLDVYDMIYEESPLLTRHPIQHFGKMRNSPNFQKCDHQIRFFPISPHLRRVHAGYRRRGRVSDIFDANLTSVAEPRFLEVEWGFPSGEAIEDMAAIEVRYRGLS